MPNIGPLELAIVAIIALIIFGPKRLPELGRSIGDGLREFKSSVSGENRDDDEDDEPPQIDNGVDEEALDEDDPALDDEDAAGEDEPAPAGSSAETAERSPS